MFIYFSKFITYYILFSDNDFVLYSIALDIKKLAQKSYRYFDYAKLDLKFNIKIEANSQNNLIGSHSGMSSQSSKDLFISNKLINYRCNQKCSVNFPIIIPIFLAISPTNS